MHTVFIEEQLTPDCFPVAKIFFVSENVISQLEIHCDFNWRVHNLRPSVSLPALGENYTHWGIQIVSSDICHN